jgi:hypothetical protein
LIAQEERRFSEVLVCGGALVKILRCLLILIILGLSSSAVLADGIGDPGVKLKGGCCSTELTSPNDPHFTFNINPGDFTAIGQSKEFDFINATGQVAIGMNLVVTFLDPVQPDLIFTCDPANVYFLDCSPQSPGSTLSGTGSLLIRFFTPNFGEGGQGGIPNDPSPNCDGYSSCIKNPLVPFSDFGIVVTDVGGDLVNSQFKGINFKGSLDVPEPSTILLILTGGVLFFFFKRP